MRVSSATASFDSGQPASLTDHELGASQANMWPRIKRHFHKLARLLTAIAHAEAGNLDEVQKILDEDKPLKKPGSRVIGNGRIEWP
jgi:hypothetical protein